VTLTSAADAKSVLTFKVFIVFSQMVFVSKSFAYEKY
jgi:hypothetical protein